MSRTGSRLIALALSHLGNKASGRIGAFTASEAAWESLNNGLMAICKDYDPPELQRALAIAITSSAYQYALPTSDDGNTIRIKNILGSRVLASGETYDYDIKRVSHFDSVSRYHTPVSSNTGRPCMYRLFHNQIELLPYPDGDYTLTLWVNIWPTLFTGATLDNVHPFGFEWDTALEYFITAELFHKLQQVEESAAWNARWEREKVQVLQVLRAQSDLYFDAADGKMAFTHYPDDSSISETSYNLETGLRS